MIISDMTADRGTHSQPSVRSANGHSAAETGSHAACVVTCDYVDLPVRSSCRSSSSTRSPRNCSTFVQWDLENRGPARSMRAEPPRSRGRFQARNHVPWRPLVRCGMSITALRYGWLPVRLLGRSREIPVFMHGVSWFQVSYVNKPVRQWDTVDIYVWAARCRADALPLTRNNLTLCSRRLE